MNWSSKVWILFCSFFCSSLFLYADASTSGQELFAIPSPPPGFDSGDSLFYFFRKIGRLHLILLHFPVALIVMTAIAELLNSWYPNQIFDHAARFMILAAAIFVIPTALFGFALSYGQAYQGLALDLFTWHRLFGIITAILTIITATLREMFNRKVIKSLTAYYICLVFLFCCINATGTFGGSLAFGIEK